MAKNQANNVMHFSLDKKDHAVFIKGTKLMGVESATPTIETEVQTFTTFDKGGWQENIATGKSMTVEFEMIYDASDPIHKELVKLFSSSDVINQNHFNLTINFPKEVSTSTSAANLQVEGSLSSGKLLGDSKEVSKLEFTFNVSGRPVFTAEVPIVKK